MILVLAEHEEGELRNITFEMLSKASKLTSGAGTEVSTLLLAGDPDEFVEELRPWADKIFVDADEIFENFNSDAYKWAIAHAINKSQPELVLIGQSSQGMEIAPPLSVKLGIPIISDATEIGWENGELIVEREIYGGRARSEVKFKNDERRLVTVRAATFEVEKAPGLDADVVEIEPSIPKEEVRKEFLNLSKPEVGEVDITASDMIVAVGRGIGDEKENLEIVEELADAIGGVVACSRPLVDKGWFSESRLIGQSGKTVDPSLLIALGISGEFYFRVGMENSDTIVAINKDENAPIFGAADYGIVNDLFEVASPLIEELKSR